jgi:hypothetical protein
MTTVDPPPLLNFSFHGPRRHDGEFMRIGHSLPMDFRDLLPRGRPRVMMTRAHNTFNHFHRPDLHEYVEIRYFLLSTAHDMPWDATSTRDSEEEDFDSDYNYSQPPRSVRTDTDTDNGF